MRISRCSTRAISYHNIILGERVLIGHEPPPDDEDMAEFRAVSWSKCQADREHDSSRSSSTVPVEMIGRVLAASLLTALGADDGAVVADYAATTGNLGELCDARFNVSTLTPGVIQTRICRHVSSSSHSILTACRPSWTRGIRSSN